MIPTFVFSGGKGEGFIADFDRENGTFTMVFKVGDEYCNGKPGKNAQVQGGFAGAMLDSVCANAVVAFTRIKTTVATLEQKVSFIKPIPPNTDLWATAKVIKLVSKLHNAAKLIIIACPIASFLMQSLC